MTLEDDLMRKARLILRQKFPDGLTTIREFRRRQACIRLNNQMLNKVLNNLEREGMLKRRQDGIIILNRKRAIPP